MRPTGSGIFEPCAQCPVCFWWWLAKTRICTCRGFHLLVVDMFVPSLVKQHNAATLAAKAS